MAGGSSRPPSRKPNSGQFHAVKFSEAGGAQMYAYDVDGDGDNDVVTSKAAHAYGLSWFENVGGDDGEIKFNEHLIMGEKPEQNEYGVAFSQLHALALADMDQRRRAGHRHRQAVLGPCGARPRLARAGRAVLVPNRRARGGKVRFVPHRIDTNSGVGTQVVAGDLNGDKWPDIVVGNKKGTFVFMHEAKEVDQANVGSGAADADEAGANSRKPATPASSSTNRRTVFRATAADGRVLNLDFETGDLTDWTATGTAFERQPIEGDTVHAAASRQRQRPPGQVLGRHVRARPATARKERSLRCRFR